MPSDDPNSRSDSRKAGGFFGLFRRAVAAVRDEEPTVLAGADGSVDIVDQAHAFQTLRVDDVKTPRADIVAVEISAGLDEVVRTFIEAEHSRMPIYRETLDDPVGVVHVKDVFKMLADEARRPAASEPVLRRLRREALYVPSSMRAADLLVRMQTSRIHMALVIDEFGGTDGLVTMEDLVESVVGEIDDEHDETSHAQIIARGGVFEADGRAPLEDLEMCLGETIAPEDIEEEVDTVGGLVSALAGRVPQRGELIRLAGRYDFEIVDADPRRVKRVRVHRVELAGPAPDPGVQEPPPAA
jgi:CBS domain containing-hemolysin-like protein